MEVFDHLLWSLTHQSDSGRVLFTFGAWFQIIKKSLENIWMGYIWYNWIFDRFEWKMDIININNIFGFGIICLHYYFMWMLDVSYLYDESSCSTKVFWSMLMPSRFRSNKVKLGQLHLTSDDPKWPQKVARRKSRRESDGIAHEYVRTLEDMVTSQAVSTKPSPRSSRARNVCWHSEYYMHILCWIKPSDAWKFVFA